MCALRLHQRGWLRALLLAAPLAVTVTLMVAAPNEPPAPQRPARAAAGSDKASPSATPDPLAELSPAPRRAFTAGPGTVPMPTPAPGDWLAVHHEWGQSLAEYLASRPPVPDATRRVIYLQPLGPAVGPPVDDLRRFAAAFFALPVRVLPALDLAAAPITRRASPDGGIDQLRTGDVLRLLAAGRPDDAYCVLGVTMNDLYPNDAWNFVFGEASPSRRTGVFSFARYDPHFWGETDDQRLLLRRSVKVLAHEGMHLFGITHCVSYSCLMNGSNHLAESDSRPLHLCPVDLAKLHAAVGFDVVARYRALAAVDRDLGFADEAGWIERCLAYIEND